MRYFIGIIDISLHYRRLFIEHFFDAASTGLTSHAIDIKNDLLGMGIV
jgi:hypothetical protein